MAKIFQPQGAIYFIEAVGLNLIKIGYSTNPLKRLIELQNASPAKLTLIKYVVGSQDTERLLHRIFAKFRKQGEWFEAHDALVQFISALSHKQNFSPEDFFSLKNFARNKK